MFASLVVLFFTIAMIYLQLSKEIYKYIKTDKNVFFVKSLYMFVVSFLIIGLSDIGLGFGILGIIIAIVNALISIFLTEDNQVEDSKCFYSLTLTSIKLIIFKNNFVY